MNSTAWPLVRPSVTNPYRLTTLAAFAGPAFMAAIAYVDPGNFATNIQAGSHYGYQLIWVVLAANLIAMVFQHLSAKVGIVTGHNLAELCRLHFSKPVVWVMWLVSELAAMATDVAELLGGALGIKLLFGLPLLSSMVVVAGISLAILALSRCQGRWVEGVITLLALLIGGCFLAELFITPVNWPDVLTHIGHPRLLDSGAVTLAVGIIGATVMPHAIYLHSGLTQQRTQNNPLTSKLAMVKWSNNEVIIALGLAGLINMAMVIMAAGAFQFSGHPVTRIEDAYHLLTPLLGIWAAGFFLVSLIASGIASSSVGMLAGDMIMQGFVQFHIPLWVRRVVNTIPAFIIAAVGWDLTHALVLSQVVLSLALPAPMLALLYFTSRPAVMGPFQNAQWVQWLAGLGGLLVLVFNFILIATYFG